MRVIGFLLGLYALLLAAPVSAQDDTWLQIEAQPSLNTAMDRARAYGALFPDVSGFRLGNGWYGIALGPLAKSDAAARLLELRRQNLIPADSYLSDGGSYGQKFWPVGIDTTPLAPAQPEATAEAPVVTEPAAEPAVAPQPVEEPEETLKEAIASEAAISQADRQLLQEALKWYGFYDGGIDGSFGRGTRASISAWQAATGFDQTGILSTKQRTALAETYQSDQAEFGFQTVSEAESGIEITLPMALIKFDRYDPPFVHYAEKSGSGLKVLLISQPGGKAGLKGLYDVLQTLEIVPTTGERELDDTSFTIHGANTEIETLAHAVASNGTIKGYLISWNLTDAARMTRILPAVQSSFRSSGDKALDPGLVPLSDAAKRGLLAGLDVRRPKLSRSGFFIDAQGTVLTTLEAVQSCKKIVLERNTEATLRFSDPATGIAVLTPNSPLAPKSVAGFAAAPPSPGAQVSVSGYSYEDKLPAPVLTLGTVEEAKGLNGEPDLTRLSLSTLPGDAGGPVLDTSGAVLGMLLPKDPNATQQLPASVAFAASASGLTSTLSANGLLPATTAVAATAVTPDAFATMARGMTVLVSCWD
ncbi:MAG: serine protease [bacterium]